MEKPRIRVKAISHQVGKAAPRMSFDGALGRRRVSTWSPTRTTTNTILASQGEQLRARCRDLLRNNSHAAAAVENFTANLIGAGIKPSSLLTDKVKRKAIMQTWADWTEEADADGDGDFYGMQETVARAIFEAGEVFVRFRDRRAEDGLIVPLQMELLESEMVPYGLNQNAPNGNIIMNGVEFDFRNKRVAYWVYPNHPGDWAIDAEAAKSLQPKRIPASEILHVFRRVRPGQVRGVPMLTPAMLRMFFLDQYDDAELERKKIAAMFAGFVTAPDPEDVVPQVEVESEEQVGGPDTGLSPLEPGTLQTLMPGEDIKFAEPADVGGSYELFQYRQQLGVYSSVGVPYMLATGDTRRASYSSLRGVIVEYRRRLEQIQYNTIVHQFCRPIWKRWLTSAALVGEVDLPDLASPVISKVRAAQRAKWIAPRFEWVDPLKDRQAEKLAVDAGFKSRSDVVEAEGYDPEENDERIRADKDREEQLDLQFPVATAAASQPGDPQEQANAASDLADNTDAGDSDGSTSKAA